VVKSACILFFIKPGQLIYFTFSIYIVAQSCNILAAKPLQQNTEI